MKKIRENSFDNNFIELTKAATNDLFNSIRNARRSKHNDENLLDPLTTAVNRALTLFRGHNSIGMIRGCVKEVFESTL